jgi:hypothetical protein
MKKVEIPRDIFKRLTAYREHLILDGHKPGVLSTTELRGLATLYRSNYIQTIHRVAEILAPYGVSIGYVGRHRWKVWVDSNTKEPVQLVWQQPTENGYDKPMNSSQFSNSI